MTLKKRNEEVVCARVFLVVYNFHSVIWWWSSCLDPTLIDPSSRNLLPRLYVVCAPLTGCFHPAQSWVSLRRTKMRWCVLRPVVTLVSSKTLCWCLIHAFHLLAHRPVSSLRGGVPLEWCCGRELNRRAPAWVGSPRGGIVRRGQLSAVSSTNRQSCKV